ncbi:DUF3221 domain-containing protein [Caldalkalibacillus salinus]|uniref:DUF3221 domain-containing protein n=1 Tax=Caldalkalibacillus salinus TaxID=2803787 RepID=UPI0019233330|nr:DUF3221 domain-containing protein [Caldalkalibacillus salinus]
MKKILLFVTVSVCMFATGCSVNSEDTTLGLQPSASQQNQSGEHDNQSSKTSTVDEIKDMDYQGTVISKKVSDDGQRILVADNIAPDDLKKYSAKELASKALSEDVDIAWYTIDPNTYSKLEIGQKVGIDLASNRQLDSRPPIRGAEKVIMIN